VIFGGLSFAESAATIKYLHAATIPLLGLLDACVLASGNSHVRERLKKLLTVPCTKDNRGGRLGEDDDPESGGGGGGGGSTNRWARRRSSGVSRQVMDAVLGGEDEWEEDTEVAMLRWSDDDDEWGGGGDGGDGYWLEDNDGDVGLLHIGGGGGGGGGGNGNGNGTGTGNGGNGNGNDRWQEEEERGDSNMDYRLSPADTPSTPVTSSYNPNEQPMHPMSSSLDKMNSSSSFFKRNKSYEEDEDDTAPTF